MDSERSDKDLERAAGCYKLLLDADSDLTSISLANFGGGDYWSTAYSQALIDGSFVSHPCSVLVSTNQLTMTRSI